jgi:hypothetical protein
VSGNGAKLGLVFSNSTTCGMRMMQIGLACKNEAPILQVPASFSGLAQRQIVVDEW